MLVRPDPSTAASPAAWRPGLWDDVGIHRQLAELSVDRSLFRLARSFRRIRSPRRILASTLAIVFFALYLANGVLILSSRPPADPERLRLWLSGGMVLYSFYHLLRCTWSQRIADLELTAAESQWLGGAPLRRSSLAIYHLGNVGLASLLKTCMVVVVLAHDVAHVPLLMTGIFVSLLSLEIFRMVTERVVGALSTPWLRIARGASAMIVLAVVLQVVAGTFAATPLGRPTWHYVLSGFQSLGSVASSTTVQLLALPWFAPSRLAVSADFSILTWTFLGVSVALIPASVGGLVAADRWSLRRTAARERSLLESGEISTAAQRSSATAMTIRLASRPDRWGERIGRWCPNAWTPALALAARQWTSVVRYWPSIVASLVVPAVLSWTPLITGQTNGQWLYVVGSIAIYTMLLAPPALRIDFRRDLKRALLLRGLPMKPWQMVAGQIVLPIAITLVFQFVTLAVATAVIRPGWLQMAQWTTILAALAVFTFAIENALFLVYPHHEKAQGLAMIVRTKLTFLGKGVVVLLALVGLLLWSAVCRRIFPTPAFEATFVIGGAVAAWSIAAIAFWTNAVAWQRFDLSDDLPPE